MTDGETQTEATEQVQLVAEEQTVETEQSATQPKLCPACNTVLTDEQLFCPNCGFKCDAIQSVDDGVSSAIDEFNKTLEANKAKKGKKKKMTIILSVILSAVVVLLASFYIYMSSVKETLIEEIESKNPRVETVQDGYQSLTPVGQMLFRDDVVEAFVISVSENTYKSNDELLNVSAINNYKKYKEIATILGIEDKKDNTNIIKHINKVLLLEKYVKYNDVATCIIKSKDAYEKCFDYVDYAADSYYYYDYYLSYAHTYAKNALSYARSYSSGDELCTKYVNALSTVESELYDLYIYDDWNYFSISNAIDTIADIRNDAQDAQDKIIEIVNSIPKIFISEE